MLKKIRLLSFVYLRKKNPSYVEDAKVKEMSGQDWFEGRFVDDHRIPPLPIIYHQKHYDLNGS